METMNEGVVTIVGTAAERAAYKLPGYILKKKIIWKEHDTNDTYSTHGVTWQQDEAGGAALVSGNVDAVTKSGVVFSRAAYQGAVASEYPIFQLYNPAASGVVLYLDLANVSATVNGVTRYGFYNTQLATEVGAGINLDAGNTASKGIMRRGTNGSILPSEANSLAFAIGLANTTVSFEFPYPLRLEEGEGLIIGIAVQGVALYGGFRWREGTA